LSGYKLKGSLSKGDVIKFLLSLGGSDILKTLGKVKDLIDDAGNLPLYDRDY